MEAALYKRTAASRGCLLLPMGIGRVPGGVWVHSACRPLALAANTLSGFLSGIQLALVPGRRWNWSPKCGTELIAECLEKVSEMATAPMWIVVQLPRDARRRRFNLLLLDRRRRPISFVKFTTNRPNLMAISTHKRLADRAPANFWAPSFIASGDDGTWHFLALSAMPNLPHYPARLSPASRRELVTEIQSWVDSVGDERNATVHGDFGPWNVRRLADRRIAIVDWEDMTIGPASVDELWHLLTWYNQRHRRPISITRTLAELEPTSAHEIARAAKFLLERLSQPEPADVDHAAYMPSRLADYARRLKTSLELVSSIA